MIGDSSMRKNSTIIGLIAISIIFGVSSSWTQDLPAEHSAAGVTVAIPDTWVFQVDQDNGSYWEAYTDIFGDGTMIIVGNTYPESEPGMNAKVAFADPVTGKVEEYWAFYTDAGQPWKGPFNEKRKDGNPARVSADRRPGGTHYIVGMESTPYLYDEFNTGDRWFQNFSYDDRVAAVQIFEKTSSGPNPITDVFDPIYQPGNLEGSQNGVQMRYGGDVEFLSNGNILVVIEDRTQNVVSGGNAAVGSIFNGQTGALIKGPFNTAGDGAAHEIWSNIAAFNGGFCVRASNVFTVFDNDGNMLYWFNQDAFSTVQEQGRGDSVRIGSNINTNYVYFAGKDSGGDMMISRFDAVATKSGDALVDTNEIYGNETDYVPQTFDRADIGVDGKGNFCIVYDDTYTTGTSQTVARIFDNKMEAVTPTFFAFTNHDGYTGDVKGYQSYESNISMNNQYIMISADGINWDSANNNLTPAEQNFFTVLNNPFWDETSVKEWELF